MTIKKKIILFALMVAICLAAQFYDKNIGEFSESTLDHIDLLTD